MIKTLLITALLALAILPEAKAYVIGTDTTLVADGVGVNVREANLDAIRNSVKLGVGIYLESKTMVNNYTVVKDAILDYSNGFVEEYKILQVSKRDDGLYQSKIQAQVRRGKIHKVLDSLNLVKINIDGKSLFANALTQIDRQKNVGKLVASALDGFPTRAIKVFIGNPSIIKVNSKTNIATASFPVNIKWNTKWLDQIFVKLNMATDSKELNIPYIDLGERTGSLYKKYCDTPATCSVIGMQEMSVKGINSNGTIKWGREGYMAWFFTEDEVSEIVRSFGRAKHSTYGAFQSANDFSMTVNLLNNGKVFKQLPATLRGGAVHLWNLKGNKLSLNQPKYSRGTVLNRLIIEIPVEYLEKTTSVEAIPVSLY